MGEGQIARINPFLYDSGVVNNSCLNAHLWAFLNYQKTNKTSDVAWLGAWIRVYSI
jgi:hypothetical protein